MTSLQTVVMGLVIVFLDIPPDGFDWIADPLGWVLILVGLSAAGDHLPSARGLIGIGWVCFGLSVLTWPAGSVANVTDTTAWLFSIPTLAWCFVLCDALMDLTAGGFRGVLWVLRNVFAVTALLPGLVFFGGVDWLGAPASVLLIVSNLVLLFVVWAAADIEVEPAASAEVTAAPVPAKSTPAPAPSPAPSSSETDQPVTGAEVLEKVRKRRLKRQRQQGASSPGADDAG